jgi:hypothetical protein
MRAMAMKETVSLQLSDLHDWLRCDDSAGQRLWWDSGLFIQLRDEAQRRGWGYVRELRRNGIWVHLTGEDMEEYATDLIVSIWDRLKSQHGPEDFPKIDDFRKYLEKSLKGIRDFIGRPRPPTPGDTDDEGADIPDPGPSTEDQIILNQRRQKAADLLTQFRDTLPRSLQNHFDRLCEAHRGGQTLPLEDVAEDIIDFLISTHQHFTDIRDYFTGISQHTYNSYNRRLRLAWRRFIQGPGQRLWEAYLGCFRPPYKVEDL